MSVVEAVRRRLQPMAQSWPSAREQSLAAAGPLCAGAGNLLFALLMARILGPGAYADLVAFLALYLLAHVFAGSLSAGTALDPALSAAMRSKLWKIGVAASLVLVVSASVVAAIVGLEPGFVLALAVAAPATGVLAAERGRLYATGDYRRLVTSMGAEPATRLVVALPLGLIGGGPGAAMGVALAGWVALAVAAPANLGPRFEATSQRLLRLPGAPAEGPTEPHVPGAGADAPAARTTVLTFLLFAVVMNQDVLWANRLLDADAAGRFAVLSTLGGVAAFATSTAPLVLLGRAGSRDAFRTAIAWSAGLGGTALLVIAAAPGLLLGVAFGFRYAAIGRIAIVYVAAMALLGVSRVFAAQLCSQRSGSTAMWVVASTAAFQSLVIVAVARSVAAVATTTFVTTATLAVVLGLVLARRRPRLSAPAEPPPVPDDFAPPVPKDVSPPVPARVAPALHLYARAAAGAAAEGIRWAHATSVREVSRSAGTALERARDLPTRLPDWQRRLRQRLFRWRIEADQLWNDRTVRWAAVASLVALAVRLAATRSVWLDEAIAVSQARLPFGQMMESLRYGDVHPPLHSVVLWVVVRVIGSSELAIRLPSIIAGTLLVPVLYGMGRELYGRRTGLVAAIFASVAPFLVWYSQEARMYSFFMLFGTLAVWAQVRVVRTGGRGAWLAYAAATALLLWTHYFAVVQVAVQQLVFVAAAWSRFRQGRAASFLRLWLGSMMLVAVAVLPAVPVLRDQLIAFGGRQTTLSDVPAQAGSHLDPAQQHLSVYALLANVVWAMWGYHSDATMAQVVALWPLGMLFILFLLGRRRSWMSSATLAVVVGPMMVLFGLGFAKRDLFELRYFAVAAPLLILFAARVVTAGVRSPRMANVITVFFCAVLVASLVDQQTNGANPRIYDFRGALQQVSSMVRPGDAVVYAPIYLEPVVDYYAPNLESSKLNGPAPDPNGRVFLLASFLDRKDVSARVGGALAELERERHLERELRLPRVRVWVFT